MRGAGLVLEESRTKIYKEPTGGQVCTVILFVANVG
jgi:hypothetical protein